MALYVTVVARGFRFILQGALRGGVCTSRIYTGRRDAEKSRRRLDDVIFYVVRYHVVQVILVIQHFIGTSNLKSIFIKVVYYFVLSKSMFNKFSQKCQDFDLISVDFASM